MHFLLSLPLFSWSNISSLLYLFIGWTKKKREWKKVHTFSPSFSYLLVLLDQKFISFLNIFIITGPISKRWERRYKLAHESWPSLSSFLFYLYVGQDSVASLYSFSTSIHSWLANSRSTPLIDWPVWMWEEGKVSDLQSRSMSMDSLLGPDNKKMIK